MLLISLIGVSAAAYEHPLNSSAIRNAYFLGSSNSESVKFISKYKEPLPPPKTGPHIAEMEVRTPFAQVVVNSREHSVGYSAQQAEQDYKKNPDTVQVRIQIRNTGIYYIGEVNPCSGVVRMVSYEDCFKFFRYSFRQGGKDLTPMSSYGVPIYSEGDIESTFVGADIWFVFSTHDIASKPFRVTVSVPGNCAFPDFAAFCSNPKAGQKVIPWPQGGGSPIGWVVPDAQQVSAEFDLASLR